MFYHERMFSCKLTGDYPLTVELPEGRRETRQNHAHRIEKSIKEWEQHHLLTPLVKGYASGDLSILLKMFGYIGGKALERPAKNLCLAFQRNKEGHLPETVEKIFFKRLGAPAKPGHRSGYVVHLYDMKASVLVDVIQRRQKSKVIPCPSEIIIPSVVWLKECECASVPLAEIADLGPLLGPLECSFLRSFPALRLIGVDGELSPPLDRLGDVPPIPPHVQCVDQMVKGAAEVEDTFPHDERVARPIKFASLDVEAILQATGLSLESDGVIVSPTSFRDRTAEFSCKAFQVAVCPFPFRPRTLKAPAHELTSS
jgi:hypothetical protein